MKLVDVNVLIYASNDQPPHHDVARGNLVSDAHVASLAIEHGAELWSFDNDFSRFPGLRWRRPGSDR